MQSTIKIAMYDGKIIVLIYLLAVFFSYLYTVIFNTYNGDFFQGTVLLSVDILLLMAILTAIPYVFIYKLYTKYYLKEAFRVPTCFNITIIRNVTWCLLLLHIGLHFMNYGTMGTSTHIDGSLFSYVRSAISKLLPRPWVIVFLLLSNSKKNIVVTVILFIIESLSAHSLGGCFLLLLLYLFRNGKKVRVLFIRNFFFVLVIICMLPVIISTAFNFRSQLRGEEIAENINNYDIVFSKMCGRVSSFSNNAYIFQKLLQIANDIEYIPSLFYLYDTLHYWGYRPEFKSVGTYVQMQIKNSKEENYSTMAGVIGVFIISYIKSPYVFLLNLFFTIFLINIIFKLTGKIFPNASSIAFLLTIGFGTSGDISELSNTIYTLLIMWILLFLSKRMLWK
ncbi:oligosaccharide repeat unit polymerase [Parabacteroides distasonis]|uniref:oligosaccharide repeat unit polymerase n=1 Tax=Parabacteroides distasonis TaxID=823 RepID=UPI002330E6C4|nr:oligosaccharide repeat unit polymerase [Parabacteroides distasonis]MDB8999713.1 oligosaccharide repeat unit polymerase [Parabacteroides distasonis]MDB9016553.1 oligosaccharide repeat unit polymerase [Parabacteroides distasonis]MDB9054742.1 oligosaccharide repeat unit polymerase [Parabacteroides distasonis]